MQAHGVSLFTNQAVDMSRAGSWAVFWDLSSEVQYIMSRQHQLWATKHILRNKPQILKRFVI